ncbi:MAG: hypothetical protein GY898_28240 [Proteobacteria bacterium]|nr:hypothetical protein [Pseudomonadota bacterium]
MAIVAPDDGDETVFGDDLLLVGLAQAFNPDDTEFLTIAWSSDRDGVLFDGPIDDAAGNSQLTVDWLAEGSHRITFAATDIGGAIGEDTADIEVLPPDAPPENEDPECFFDSPLDGATLVADASHLLSGAAADPDATEGGLVAAFSSSIQGELGEIEVEDGQASLLTELIGAEHVLEFEVEDAAGGRCTEEVSVVVCSAPSASIVLPTTSTTINAGDTLLVQGEVGDDEDDAADLTVWWTSSVAGPLVESSPTAGGVTLEELADLPAGAQLVTLEATDSCGLVASDSVTVIVTAVPTAPGVVISPDDPDTSDALTAVVIAASTDPDGGAPTLEYSWTADLVPQPYTGAAVPSSATTKNEVWEVTVTGTDGEAASPAARRR